MRDELLRNETPKNRTFDWDSKYDCATIKHLESTERHLILTFDWSANVQDGDLFESSF